MNKIETHVSSVDNCSIFAALKTVSCGTKRSVLGGGQENRAAAEPEGVKIREE